MPPAEGWHTVCSGRKFWDARFDVPRKCTQSVVAVNAARTEVRKTCRDRAAFEREAAALARLGTLGTLGGRGRDRDRGGDGRAPFPRLLRSDARARTLVTQYCGEPVAPDAIPAACREQARRARARSLSRALALARSRARARARGATRSEMRRGSLREHASSPRALSLSLSPARARALSYIYI